MRLLPAALHASRLALLDVALTRGRVQSTDSASKDSTKPAKQAGVEGKKQSAEEDAAELKGAPDHSRFNPQPMKKGAEQSAPLDNMAKGPCLHPALECCARHEACRERCVHESVITLLTMIGLKGVRSPFHVDNFAVLVRLRT